MTTPRSVGGLRRLSTFHTIAASDSSEAPISETPELCLSLPTAMEEGGLAFGLSFCRWLLAAFDQVELVCEPPSPLEWKAFADEFGGPATKQGRGGSLSGQSIPVQENLSVTFAETPLESSSAGGAPRPTRMGVRTGEWAHLPSQPGSLGVIRVRVVQSDMGPELLPWVERATLWVALLPGQVDPFARYYQLIKSTATSKRSHRKFYGVLSRPGPDHDLKKVRVAWDSVTERFLGWPVPLLGQIDPLQLSSGDVEVARRIRLCEETLGPPWPSDLQTQCNAACSARVLDSADRARFPDPASFIHEPLQTVEGGNSR